MTIKLRPEVRRFAELMEQKLRKHDKDWGDGWRFMWDEDCWDLIHREISELKRIPYDGSERKYRRQRALECADVANGLMFLSEARDPRKR